MPKGIMLTPEEQMERRQEIIDIALRLTAQKGFQKTSMREIAEGAGMGKSSLYDFFKTKDEIVVYAVEKEIEGIIQKAEAIIREEPPSEQCLRKIMLAQLAIPMQQRAAMMWLNAESNYLEKEYRDRVKAARYKYQGVIQTVLDNGVATGVFRKTDTALLTRLLLNSMLSIVFTSRPSGSQKEMLDEAMNIFLNGVMKK